ncbi:hypothetical protein [Nocardioides houyundeii]|uniref:hypothetical protein n=1 Tax=Nocardioides houyundeii TaxID=2045452 RepID=UPI0013159846|nr:hypothetical protein [Nocardioides houyundeii]
MRDMFVGVTYIGKATREWRHLRGLMTETAEDFAAAPIGVLPSRVQPTGEAFFQAWTTYAGEAAREAGEFVTSLQATVEDFQGVESQAVEQFTGLSVARLDDTTTNGTPANNTALSSRLGAVG